MTRSPQENDPATQRWTLLRDIGVLQLKLIVDGLRDLILVPASLIAGIASLASAKNGRPGLHFYHLLGWGKQSEIWINLFGAVKNSPEEIDQHGSFGERGIDDIVARLEFLVVEEVKRGGITAQAKERLEKFLNAVQRQHRE